MGAFQNPVTHFQETMSLINKGQSLKFQNPPKRNVSTFLKMLQLMKFILRSQNVQIEIYVLGFFLTKLILFFSLKIWEIMLRASRLYAGGSDDL